MTFVLLWAGLKDFFVWWHFQHALEDVTGTIMCQCCYPKCTRPSFSKLAKNLIKSGKKNFFTEFLLETTPWHSAAFETNVLIPFSVSSRFLFHQRTVWRLLFKFLAALQKSKLQHTYRAWFTKENARTCLINAPANPGEPHPIVDVHHYDILYKKCSFKGKRGLCWAAPISSFEHTPPKWWSA